MSYECNEGLERAVVLVATAKDVLATGWEGLGYAEGRDREHLIGRLEDAIQDLREAVGKLKEVAA
jgi:hypothetical protein